MLSTRRPWFSEIEILQRTVFRQFGGDRKNLPLAFLCKQISAPNRRGGTIFDRYDRFILENGRLENPNVLPLNLGLQLNQAPHRDYRHFVLLRVGRVVGSLDFGFHDDGRRSCWVKGARRHNSPFCSCFRTSTQTFPALNSSYMSSTSQRSPRMGGLHRSRSVAKRIRSHQLGKSESIKTATIVQRAFERTNAMY